MAGQSRNPTITTNCLKSSRLGGVYMDRVGASVDQVGVYVDRVGASVDQVGVCVDASPLFLASSRISLRISLTSLSFSLIPLFNEKPRAPSSHQKWTTFQTIVFSSGEILRRSQHLFTHLLPPRPMFSS